MILKMRSAEGWVVVPGIEQAEYGGPESKKMGFYVSGEGEYKVYVPVVKSGLQDEDWYYPHDDVWIVRSAHCCGVPSEVQVNGRSNLEAAYLNESKDGNHAEPIVFMAWLQDSETKKTFLFDEAYLLNDSGKTIERIW